ncbi:MAG: MFS transporter, partial [Clostridium sp.]
VHKVEEITFVEDFKDGLKFLWDFRVLRKLFIFASLLNLFANAAFILILPYFRDMPFLGPEKYGVFMAVIPLGMLTGSILLSIIDVKKQYKFKLYIVGILVCLVALPFAFLIDNFYIMLAVGFVSFLGNVVFNTIFNSVIMLVVPVDKRGKVGALMNTVSGSLQPAGVLIGGILGDIIPIRLAIISLLVIAFIFGLGLIMLKGTKSLIEYDSNYGTVEELIEETNGISA